MSTDSPAGYDPDTWEAAIAVMKDVEVGHRDEWFGGYADELLRAALAVLGSGETQYGLRWPEAAPFDNDPEWDEPEDGVDLWPDRESVDRAAAVWRKDGFVTEIVQRRVGPWTPVEVTDA